MRKRLPMFVGILIFSASAVGFGWGALTHTVTWLIFGGIMLFSGFQYLNLLVSLRLASDWPTGIIWAAGWFAGRESQRKRHAKKRNPFHLVKRQDIGQDYS